MVIIKFIFKNRKCTYFIHNNWISVISFLLGRLIARKIKKVLLSRKTEQKILESPRGGTGLKDQLYECIDLNQIYEVQDRLVISSIRKLLVWVDEIMNPYL